MKCGYGAGQGCTGTIRTTHGLYILKALYFIVDIDIDVTDTAGHTGIQHLYKIVYLL